MNVISSEGAYLAYEDFKEDTVVDVKPYTPANMHPVYTINQYTVGNDNTGFVLDTAGYGSTNTTSLVYMHKPGTEYPVTCLVAPETNLDWRDYTFTDTIIKPSGSVYDSIELSIPFYFTSESSTYELKFKQNGVFISGGGFKNLLISNTKINGGDEMAFAITAETNSLGDVLDGETYIRVSFKKN